MHIVVILETASERCNITLEIIILTGFSPAHIDEYQKLVPSVPTVHWELFDEQLPRQIRWWVACDVGDTCDVRDTESR